MSLESPVASVVAPPWAVTLSEGRARYLDEDAGSLDSAGRGLALSEDEHASLGERLRVLADVGRFLDEFFQLTGADVGAEARLRVLRLLVRQRETLERLRSPMTACGVELCGWSELNDDDRKAVSGVFEDRVRPVLVPLLAEEGKPLPPVANLSINVAVAVRDRRGGGRLRAGARPPRVPPLWPGRPP